MAEKSEAENLKEAVVEYYMRSFKGSFTKDISPISLTQISSLDTDLLGGAEPSFCLREGIDISTALHCCLDDDDKTRKLMEILNPIFKAKDRSLAKHVEDLLVEDIRNCQRENCCGVNKLENIVVERLHNLASIVSMHRMMLGVKRFQISNRNDDYSVFLHTLIDGDGGRVKRELLYFSYGTSFGVFLNSLKEDTMLSLIPPVDMAPLTAFWASMDGDPLPTKAGDSIASSTTVKSSDDGSPAARSKFMGMPAPAFMPTARPRSSSMKGYTLSDGPWISRLIRNRVLIGEWFEIKDEDSYLKMVDLIKTTQSNDPDNNYKVFLMHSMDRDCENNWLECNRQEIEARAKDLESWKALDWGDSECDDVGIGWKSLFGYKESTPRKTRDSAVLPSSSPALQSSSPAHSSSLVKPPPLIFASPDIPSESAFPSPAIPGGANFSSMLSSGLKGAVFTNSAFASPVLPSSSFSTPVMRSSAFPSPVVDYSASFPSPGIPSRPAEHTDKEGQEENVGLGIDMSE